MKWPQLIPCDARGSRPHDVAPHAWKRWCEVSAEVYRRTFARMFLDVRRRELVFGYERPWGQLSLIGLPSILPARLGTDTANLFDPAVDRCADETPCGIDDVCYTIQLGKVDVVRKDQWLAARRKSAESEKAERWGRWMDSTRKDTRREAERRSSRARIEQRSSKRREILAGC